MLRCSGWMLGHILTSRIHLRSHWLLLLWLFHLCIPITASSALNHRSTTGVFRHVKHRGHFSGKLSCHLVSRRCLHRQMHPVQCQCFTATRYTAYDTVMYYIMFGTCRLSGKKMFTFFQQGSVCYNRHRLCNYIRSRSTFCLYLQKNCQQYSAAVSSRQV